MTSPGRLGVLTTDVSLVVLSWDDWLAAATGISASEARGRPLGDLIPGLRERRLLERFAETLSSGAAQVFSSALHGGLVRCAPLNPSTHFDVMQQRVTVGPLLDDGRIAGLVISVQDVTAALDAERELADALVSGDPETRRTASEAIAASSRIESIDSFSPALRSDDWRVRRAAVGGLAEAADQELLRAVLETLQREHRDFSTLSSALRLLAVADADITAPLAELLEHADADLRIQAALALGEQQDPAAIPPLLAALDDTDANVRFHAIEGLGRLRAASAVDRLLTIAEGDDFFLAFAALEALATIGDSRAAARLVPLVMRDAVREPATRALSRLGDERAVVPLVETLNRSRDAAVDVITGLSAIADRLAGEQVDVAMLVRDTLSNAGRSHVFEAAERARGEALPAAARVLGWAGGSDAIGALGRLLREPVARDQAVEALVAQGDRAVDMLADALAADDDELRAAAIASLGRIGSSRATARLIELLDDPETSIGASGALARIGDPAAFEPLMALAAHGDTAVRLAAIGALNSIGHPAMPARVATLLAAHDPVARESAVRIAGYFGYPNALEQVLACASDPFDAVRIAALEHLPFFDDDRALAVLTAALRDDTPKARAAAARALARCEAADARTPLIAALDDPDPWVRYFAARSLGQLDDGGSSPALVGRALADPSLPVRVAALEAIAARGVSEPLEPLLQCAADDNDDIAAAALFALGRVGGDEGLPALQVAARQDAPSRRKAAAHGLGAHASAAAVEALEWLAAADSDAFVVDAAVRGLEGIAAAGNQAADRAVDSLMALFADADRAERAIAAVARLPLAAIGRVGLGMHHPHPSVRRRTIDALTRYRRPEATRLLAPAFDDQDPRVREAAAAAVGRLGSRLFDDTLRRLAGSDPSKSVRRAAADALSAARAGV